MNIHMILRIFKQYILLVEIFIFYITVKEAEVMNFKSKVKPRNPEKKQNKKDVLKNVYALFDGRERVFETSESKIFQNRQIVHSLYRGKKFTAKIYNKIIN